MALKKELEVYNKPGSRLYSLRFIKGGELPDALKTEYTSVREAEKQRDLYYASKLPKKDKEQAA